MLPCRRRARWRATGQWRARLWPRLAAAAVVALLLRCRCSSRTCDRNKPRASAARCSRRRIIRRRCRVTAGAARQSRVRHNRCPAAIAHRGRAAAIAAASSISCFPGCVLLALAGVGARTRHGGQRRATAGAVERRVWSSSASCCRWVRTAFVRLYAALHDNVYGFQAIRAPARFAVIAMLGLRCWRRWDCARLAARMPRTRLRTARRHCCRDRLAAAVLEYLNAPLPLAAAPPRTTAVGQWLAGEPDARRRPAPAADDRHREHAVHGAVARARPADRQRLQRPAAGVLLAAGRGLADLPSPTALATLARLDVRFVVSPATVAGAGDRRRRSSNARASTAASSTRCGGRPRRSRRSTRASARRRRRHRRARAICRRGSRGLRRVLGRRSARRAGGHCDPVGTSAGRRRLALRGARGDRRLGRLLLPGHATAS